MSLWHCCFISFMLHFWFPTESWFFSPSFAHIYFCLCLCLLNHMFLPVLAKMEIGAASVVSAAAMKTMRIWAIKCTATSSKGQIEKRGHTKAWMRCWINTLIGGNYVLGAPVGLVSSASGPHKYTFKRHVARSRSNLFTMNLCIIVFITSSITAALRRKPTVVA